MRVAVLDDYLNVARASADWSVLDGRADLTVFHEAFDDAEAAVTALQSFEVVVAMRERTPFPRAVLERLPNLKLLITTGMRNLAIDVAAARKRGVVVCGTRSDKAPTAELTWALILGLARNVATDHAAMRAGGWQSRVGVGLGGRTLGLLGLGSIGTLVARAGQTFGMDVVAWSQNLTAERAAEVGVRRVAREELFESADVLSIHVVLSERTRGLVGARELGLMKPTAFLVNTSRAPIVDEAALIAALDEGRLAGAALDVYDQEPLPGDHPLRRTERLLLTPHMGYVSDANMATMYRDAVADIVAFLDGAPVREIV